MPSKTERRPSPKVAPKDNHTPTLSQVPNLGPYQGNWLLLPQLVDHDRLDCSMPSPVLWSPTRQSKVDGTIPQALHSHKTGCQMSSGSAGTTERRLGRSQRAMQRSNNGTPRRSLEDELEQARSPTTRLMSTRASLPLKQIGDRYMLHFTQWWVHKDGSHRNNRGGYGGETRVLYHPELDSNKKDYVFRASDGHKYVIAQYDGCDRFGRPLPPGGNRTGRVDPPYGFLNLHDTRIRMLHTQFSPRKSQKRPAGKTPRQRRAHSNRNQGPTRPAVRTDARTGLPPVKKKWKSGTVALRQIRKYQASTELLLPRAPFMRTVREVCWKIKSDLRITRLALAALQTAAEAHLVEVFQDSNLIMLNAKRKELQLGDVHTAMQVGGHRLCSPPDVIWVNEPAYVHLDPRADGVVKRTY